VRTYVRSHADDALVRKVRSNQQLATADLDELAERFVEAGFGTTEDVEQATGQHRGFGLFLRAMTGLDYEPAAAAFASVRSGQTLTPQQAAYLELLSEVVAKNGTATVDDLYKSPFTNRARGLEDVFTDANIDAVLETLQDIQARAQPDTVS
jgi:type I restriction enzyme, R subunit